MKVEGGQIWSVELEKKLDVKCEVEKWYWMWKPNLNIDKIL